MKEIEIVLYGRVQGILFRRFIRRRALLQGLNGFAGNQADGSVVVVAQGSGGELSRFLSWLRGSPGFSKVKTVEFNFRDNSENHNGFRIIRSRNYLFDKFRGASNLSNYLIDRYVDSIPRHIAIIPDGNRRWARIQKLGASVGHYKAGSYGNLKVLINEAIKFRVEYLSIWAFSTENWKRDKKEIDAIFDLILKGISRFGKEFKSQGIRFVHVGRKDRLPKKLLNEILRFEEETKENGKFTLVFCLDYGGRDEILRAVKSRDNFKNFTEEKFSEILDTSEISDPDLIIRTGGEKRLSGFMPWQSVYSELYFINKYFPDFSARDLRKAIREFSRRQRRFGE